MTELGKIRWQCRRGLLELDLILEKFSRNHLTRLNSRQLECFTELLAFPDNELLDLVMGRTEAAEPRFGAVLELLRAT
jgi:antitoxin CptB